MDSTMITSQELINDNHRIHTSQLDVPPRTLLGPGPSNAHPRVLQALSMRQVGHLDPAFIAIMDEIKELLRYTWQTENDFTFAVSGTGSAAMETCIANLVEPGDVIVVAVNGYFGERLVEMASRYGADVKRLDKEWGKVFSLEEIESALKEYNPAIFAIVHAETSTGALQPLAGIGDLCHQYGSLLIADCVTSLGGVEIFVDDWDIDAAYSCSQKCLSCPSGLGPISFSPRALQKRQQRQTEILTWYYDISLLDAYWSGEKRAYHHTAPINMNYALREGLRLVAAEGLEQRWSRHRDNAELLWKELGEIGLECFAEESIRIPSLTTIAVPAGTDAAAVTSRLLNEYNIEVGGGFGPLAGKVWRVGLMGYNSRPENVALLKEALRQVLN